MAHVAYWSGAAAAFAADVTKVLVLGGAVVALLASGHPRLAVVLAGVIVVGQILSSVSSDGSTVP